MKSGMTTRSKTDKIDKNNDTLDPKTVTKNIDQITTHKSPNRDKTPPTSSTKCLRCRAKFCQKYTGQTFCQCNYTDILNKYNVGQDTVITVETIEPEGPNRSPRFETQRSKNKNTPQINIKPSAPKDHQDINIKSNIYEESTPPFNPNFDLNRVNADERIRTPETSMIKCKISAALAKSLGAVQL